MSMLERRHLLLVRAIAEQGSVTRAALGLHLTQSALSHQLKDAEEQLGTRLFDRVGRRLLLNDAGRRLLRSADSVLRELESVERELQSSASRPAPVLRLTTQCNTVYHWLPSRLRLFHASHPDVVLQVVNGVAPDPLPSLLEGAIDLAIVYRPVRDRRLTLRPLFRDEMVVVMPLRHRLAARHFIRAEDLAPEHLVLYSTPREANMVFREVLNPAGVSPARVTHIQLTEAIVEIVKEGLGVSVLPRWSVAAQLDRGELVARSLTEAGRFRNWGAAYRRRPTPPGHLLAFVDLLARHPLPLGRTARQRKRLAAAITTPGAA